MSQPTPYPNTQGPPPYRSGQPNMDPSQGGYNGNGGHGGYGGYGGHGGYGGNAPVIVMQQQMQQQQMQQQVIVSRSRTSHGLCCLICVLTGGLSIPCWIYACIVD